MDNVQLVGRLYYRHIIINNDNINSNNDNINSNNVNIATSRYVQPRPAQPQRTSANQQPYVLRAVCLLTFGSHQQTICEFYSYNRGAACNQNTLITCAIP
jgi:hypothetical protein